eukprot:6507109-Prymnesium_polylepis.1
MASYIQLQAIANRIANLQNSTYYILVVRHCENTRSPALNLVALERLRVSLSGSPLNSETERDSGRVLNKKRTSSRAVSTSNSRRQPTNTAGECRSSRPELARAIAQIDSALALSRARLWTDEHRRDLADVRDFEAATHSAGCAGPPVGERNLGACVLAPIGGRLRLE